MRFYSSDECAAWLRDRARHLPEKSTANNAERIVYPKEPHRVFSLARCIAHSLTCRMPSLLWLTEWGIWRSSENWHLYYKLRQSYANHKLLQEAPGHLFLDYEAEDLASFLQIAMLNGWGGYLLTQANYVNAFFSHDEYIDFFAERSENLEEVRQALSPKHERT